MNKSALFDMTSAALFRDRKNEQTLRTAERALNVWREQYHDNEGHRADKTPDEVVIHPQPAPTHKSHTITSSVTFHSSKTDHFITGKTAYAFYEVAHY